MESNPAVVEARRVRAEAGLHARVGTTAQLLAWVQLDAATCGPILDERLKLRWARQEARTKSKHRAVLMRFWARVARGNAAHGTAGAASATVAYGSADFAANRQGCRSVPTVSFAEAAVKVLGRLNTWRTPEWGTTPFSSCHGEQMPHVEAAPTRRQLLKREARQRRRARRQERQRAGAPAPGGGGGAAPPAPAAGAPEWLEMHGLRVCPHPACKRLVARDRDAARSIGSALWAHAQGLPRPACLQPRQLPPTPGPAWRLGAAGPPGVHPYQHPLAGPAGAARLAAVVGAVAAHAATCWAEAAGAVSAAVAAIAAWGPGPD